MKRTVRVWMAAAMGGIILAGAAGSAGQMPWGMVAEAHSGRTDSSGGHHDNKNVSGLGSYHYHCGGHPAHLHSGGVCPYDGGTGSGNTQTGKSQGTQTQTSQTQASQTTGSRNAMAASEVPRTQSSSGVTGWHSDGTHWRYTCEDQTEVAGCWKQIDSVWYSFDSEGCMRTGWYGENGNLYYLGNDGKMVTGTCTIDGDEYQFDQDGRMENHS